MEYYWGKVDAEQVLKEIGGLGEGVRLLSDPVLYFANWATGTGSVRAAT